MNVPPTKTQMPQIKPRYDGTKRLRLNDVIFVSGIAAFAFAAGVCSGLLIGASL